MTTISPAVAEAFSLLQDNLYGHLDEAEYLADKLSEGSEEDIDTARQLIPDLVLVIRGLLVEHWIRAGGECPICESAWPCPVVTTVHAFIKDPQEQYVALIRRVHGSEASGST